MDDADNPKLRQELRWVEDQPASAWAPPENKSIAVLYSGYQGRNSEYAQQDCTGDASPHYTIEQTTAGIELQNKALYSEGSGLSRDEADQVWKEASARFAQNITGPVETHIVSSDKTRVARDTELPDLLDLEKTKATTINGIPVAELRQMPPTEAYYAVCQAEVSQAQERAAQDPGNTDLPKRALDKQEGLHAMIGRDMAWNAQHSANPASAPDPNERISLTPPPNEGPEPNVRYVPSPDPEGPQAEKLPRGLIPPPNEFAPPASPAPANDNVPPPPRDAVPAPAPPAAQHNAPPPPSMT